jgi:hypothetical protein
VVVDRAAGVERGSGMADIVAFDPPYRPGGQRPAAVEPVADLQRAGWPVVRDGLQPGWDIARQDSRTPSIEDSSGANTSGCRSRNPVSVPPARNAAWRSTRTRRSRLVVTPWICARASAPASTRAASARVGAHAMSLASIGS